MPRTRSYLTAHNGSSPPWSRRETAVVIEWRLAQAIVERVKRSAAEANRRFTLRAYGTVVLWKDGRPVASFTLRRGTPTAADATIRRIEWDATTGWTEEAVWQAVAELRGPRTQAVGAIGRGP